VKDFSAFSDSKGNDGEEEFSKELFFCSRAFIFCDKVGGFVVSKIYY